MAELSPLRFPDALPKMGTLRERLGHAKREWVDVSMEKGDSWTTKVLNSQSGVMLDDIERLASLLDLKLVKKNKVCIDPEVAKAYDIIVKRLTAEHNLLAEDAE